MKKVLINFKNFDKSVSRLVRSGIHFSFIFCLLATLYLALYHSSHILNSFYIGISLLQSSLFFMVAFIIYGIVFDKMKK